LRPRILVFEDNDIVRSTLEHIFRRLGYEVYTFSDPEMCQLYDSAEHDCSIENACADIIISDIQMPTKTGLELFKELRQKGCKVKYWALMSADWSDSNLKKAQKLGCQIFYKPFSMEKMLKWINDSIKKLNPERKLSNLPKKPD
jgi:CheY-like chemotaxis protein